MEKRLFFILISSLISAMGSNDSPMRSIHSKSAGEIPSLGHVEHAAAVFTSPEKLGHRKRSSSEREHPQASTSCPTSSIGWTSHRIVRPSKPQAATHRPSLEVEPQAPRKVSTEELQQIKEEKWRRLRRHHFRTHRRTGSLPGTEEFPAMYLLMEHSEQYAQVQQIRTKCAVAHERAARVQEQYINAAASAGELLDRMDTAPHKEILKKTEDLLTALHTEVEKRTEQLSLQETRYEDLVTKINAATNALNRVLLRINLLTEQHTPTEPTSPRGSDKEGKDHRKSSASFLGFHLPGSSKD
jgi:hypothetical protein